MEEVDARFPGVVLALSETHAFEGRENIEDLLRFVKNAPVVAYFVDVVEQEFLFYRMYAHRPKHANFFRYYREGVESNPYYQFPVRRYYSVLNTVMNSELLRYFFLR